MSLANGRSYLAIPGPSVIPEAVLQAMHRSSPNIYDGELVDMMPPLLADLCAVARTDQNVALYIANGHGAWEAAARSGPFQPIGKKKYARSRCGSSRRPR